MNHIWDPSRSQTAGKKEKGPGDELLCRVKGSIQGTGTGVGTGSPVVLMGQEQGQAPSGAGQGHEGLFVPSGP